MSVRDNLEAVRERMAQSAIKAGRLPEDITLVAVSKTKPVELIAQAVEAGALHLGENRVQEMMSKIDLLPKEVKWHLIGQLQKNKVKYIIDKVELVHSLCTLSVAAEMQRLCEKHDTHLDCLIELNVAREDSKSGLLEEDIPAFLDAIAPMDRVHIKGLMTVAPIAADPDEVRPVFAKMRSWFDKLAAEKRNNFSMEVLSMGMSGDFPAAIEEGATMVRVGSSIFGDRIYN
ncbi:MAG: YggS family pyridoxal phosphate-dependent enzyme [Christensenellaceae bacterium]|nr:YggS family pyridoxal phosphate-dependent enzyme [Christensenellaceae bacterium]